MWKTFASELAVHETVRTVAHFLRDQVFPGYNGPILRLSHGGWANRVFADFRTAF
jgi:hypothetical protein